MNHQHPNLKFTFELNKITLFHFWMLKFVEKNDRFTTSIYRKPTFSGVFTHFDSFIPTSYKQGLVNTLIFRCFKICSSYEKIHNEIVSLKIFLNIILILRISLIIVSKYFSINSMFPRKFIKQLRKNLY